MLIVSVIFISMTMSLSGMQQKASVIEGTISDPDGKVLSGAAVTIENTYLGTYSGQDGKFIISGLDDGTYTLRCSLLGYESVEQVIQVKGRTRIDVVLNERLLNAGEVIVSATRAGRTTPFAYTMIDNQKISGSNIVQDIPFLLSLTPSLVETSESGNGIGYTNLRIRGTESSRINVTIDGVPLNDPESQQVFWVDLPDLASSVENIQVQRGVGTSSNGSGAFGATINIQTKNPENEPFANISTSFGSFNTFKNNVEAGTGLIANRFALQMRLSDMKSDGYVDRTGSKHRSAFISSTYRIGNSRLKANIIIGEEHTKIGWWGVPKEMLRIDRKYNPAGEYSDANGIVQHYSNESDNYFQNHFQLFYNLKISDKMHFNSAFHYTNGKGYYEEYKEDDAFSDYGLPDVLAGSLTFTESDMIRRKWMSNDFYGMVWSLRYGGDRLEMTAGGATNFYAGRHFGRLVWMQNAGDVPYDYQWYHNTGDKGEVSLYLKSSYKVGERISVFGDIQYRSINYAMRGPDDDQRDLTQEHNFSFLNPKAGIFWTISRNQEAFVSLSVAGREPTRSDFKEAAGDPSATPRAETLYDAEAGYKMNTENVSLSVNLYGMYYNDQLVPTGELSDVGYPVMTNVDKSFRTGIEVNAGFRPLRFIDWNLGATVSRNKIMDFTEYFMNYNTADWSQEYRSNNLGMTDIAYSPGIMAASDITIKASKVTEVHFISKYVGRQYFDNTMDPERMLDPYFFSNLRIDFVPDIKKVRSLRLQFVVNNVFNTEYESNAYGGNWYEDGVEKSWSYWFPQAGTNFMVKLELGF